MSRWRIQLWHVDNDVDEDNAEYDDDYDNDANSG